MTTSRTDEVMRLAEVKQDDIEYYVSDWHQILLVRGHVDKEAMRAAALKYQDGEGLDGFSGPEHEWWRKYPKIVERERVTWTAEAKPGARGAFKVTVMVKDW